MTPLNHTSNLYFKREDLNPTGSAKDRAISQQIENLVRKNFHSAVISSSGNAAISAIHYCQQSNIPLTIFLSPKIDPNKLKLIQQRHPKIHFSPKPVSDAFKFSKANSSYYLRQSTDPTALKGYQQISKELISQLPQITSIFIPVGSGTTLLGLSQTLPNNVKIFAAQPASYCPISSLFDRDYQPEQSTITDALSVKSLPLKSSVITAIRQSRGRGIVVQNQSVMDAQTTLLNLEINCSPEGALAYAAFLKTQKIKSDPGDYPVILITGTQR